MSQFDGLLDIKTDKKTTPKPKPVTTQKATSTPPLESRIAPVKQSAKSKDTDYIQTSVYLKRETHTMAKRALLVDPQRRDFSVLVEDLILGWASKNQ